MTPNPCQCRALPATAKSAAGFPPLIHHRDAATPRRLFLQPAVLCCDVSNRGTACYDLRQRAQVTESQGNDEVPTKHSLLTHDSLRSLKTTTTNNELSADDGLHSASTSIQCTGRRLQRTNERTNDCDTATATANVTANVSANAPPPTLLACARIRIRWSAERREVVQYAMPTKNRWCTVHC